MRCPICFKEVSSRVFYDHMGEYHGWSLAEAEKYADDLYLETHSINYTGERTQ